MGLTGQSLSNPEYFNAWICDVGSGMEGKRLEWKGKESSTSN
jgi:hypothetical protein